MAELEIGRDRYTVLENDCPRIATLEKCTCVPLPSRNNSLGDASFQKKGAKVGHFRQIRDQTRRNVRYLQIYTCKHRSLVECAQDRVHRAARAYLLPGSIASDDANMFSTFLLFRWY